MGKKILIIGNTIPDALMLQKLKEDYGKDCEIYTPEEAQKAGLGMEDFGNIPTMKLTNIYDGLEEIKPLGTYKDGKSKRRERREEERKSGKQ